MSINHAAIKSSHIYLLIIKICRHIETAVLAVRNVRAGSNIRHVKYIRYVYQSIKLHNILFARQIVIIL